MTDVISAVGKFYAFTAGYLVTDENNVVLAPTLDRIQQGWPTWSYRFAHPLDKMFTQTFNPTSGSAAIYDLNPAVVGPIRGTFDMGHSGRESVIESTYFGTFSDFAIYTADASGQSYGDPAGASVISQDLTPSQIGGYSTSNLWTVNRRSVYPPRGAAYAVPKVSIPSLGAGVTQYLDAFQLQVGEVKASDLAFFLPRHLQVIIKPSRRNLSRQPSFSDFTHLTFVDSNCSVEQDTAFYPDVSVSKTSLHVTPVVGATGILTLEDSDRPVQVTPGESVTYSVYYRSETELTGDYRPVLAFFNQDNVPVFNVAADVRIQNTRGGWGRLDFTVTVPDRATLMLPLSLYAVSGATEPEEFWVSCVLIEESTVLGDYFDGHFGGDCLWADGSDEYAQGFSYYYPDRNTRNSRVHQVLQDNVMLGVQVDDPKYGVETFIHGVNPPVVGGYGFGTYGYGAYGTGQ